MVLFKVINTDCAQSCHSHTKDRTTEQQVLDLIKVQFLFLVEKTYS